MNIRGRVNTALTLMSGLAQDIKLRFLFSEHKKLPASRCKGFSSYFQKTKSLTFTENTTFFNEVLRGAKQHSFLKSIHYLRGKLKPRSSDVLEHHLCCNREHRPRNPTRRYFGVFRLAPMTCPPRTASLQDAARTQPSAGTFHQQPFSLLVHDFLLPSSDKKPSCRLTLFPEQRARC